MADSTKKHQIWIDSDQFPTTRGVFVNEESSLLANLLAQDIEIDHSCGGFGTCGTCRVEVVQGLENFSAIEEIEAELRVDRGLGPKERLSCQSHIHGNVKIKIP